MLQVKTGLFAEHSNQLWNISAVPSWTKINGGLIKMYKAEVSVFTQFQIKVLFNDLFLYGVCNNYASASCQEMAYRSSSGSEMTESRKITSKLQLLRQFCIKSILIKFLYPCWLAVKTQNSGSTWGYHFLRSDIFIVLQSFWM